MITTQTEPAEPPAQPEPAAVDAPESTAAAPAAAGQPPALLPGDFYLEGGDMVFTTAYHLRRGYCCGSRCRHCPYQQWKR